ncbi:MAG: hypothetical protein AABW79_04495 [Nanoarchaeota archaeon]
MTIEFEAGLKRWGRSFGIVVPMEKVRLGDFRENEKLRIAIVKEKTPLKKHFGSHTFSRSVEEILNEGDRESWDE